MQQPLMRRKAETIASNHFALVVAGWLSIPKALEIVPSSDLTLLQLVATLSPIGVLARSLSIWSALLRTVANSASAFFLSLNWSSITSALLLKALDQRLGL